MLPSRSDHLGDDLGLGANQELGVTHRSRLGGTFRLVTPADIAAGKQ